MDTTKITRFEIIDHTRSGLKTEIARRVVIVSPNMPVLIDVQLQDEGRTLKVFLSERKGA